MSTGFDPWHLTGPSLQTDEDILTKFSPSLVKRAQRRVVTEGQDGDTWIVVGDKKLGDSYAKYFVRWDEDNHKYRCPCKQQIEYGHFCSHALAVILYRRGLLHSPTPTVRGSGDGVETVGGGTGTSADGTAPPEVEVPTPRSNRSTPTSPLDPAWLNGNRDHPLPAWVEEIRPEQLDAVDEAIELYSSGCDVVMVDAPTGSGKTLIGEMVRRRLDAPALYVCSSKGLQEQFVRDFAYSKVLMGRANYKTEYSPWPEVTCADCTKDGESYDSCAWCSDVRVCSYEVAKVSALRSRLAVINTSYLLTETNYVGRFSGRGLGIIDECDVIEQELMGFVEFSIGERLLDTLGLTAPRKGSRKTTIASWLEGEVAPAIQGELRNLNPASKDTRVIRRRKGLENTLRDIYRIVRQYKDDESDEDSGPWVRDNDAGPMVLKPVTVNLYGPEYLWRHAKKWLMMSATIISPAQLADDLGLDRWRIKDDVTSLTGDDRPARYGVVSVPMTFPVENRRIILAGVANMTYKEKARSYPIMAKAVEKVLDRHPNERILVHTVSYDLARYLHGELVFHNPGEHPIFVYTNAREKAQVLEKWRIAKGGVLLAASMDRGVDLKDDDCRVVVIAKVPFGNLSDKPTSARLHSKGGQGWYTVQCIRTIVQMTGRHVRHKDDWGVTYILDQQFGSRLFKGGNRSLFPQWWREAVDQTVSPREFR